MLLKWLKTMQLQSCNQMLQDVAIYFTVLLAKDLSCSDQPVAVLGLQTETFRKAKLGRFTD